MTEVLFDLFNCAPEKVSEIVGSIARSTAPATIRYQLHEDVLVCYADMDMTYENSAQLLHWVIPKEFSPYIVLEDAFDQRMNRFKPEYEASVTVAGDVAIALIQAGEVVTLSDKSKQIFSSMGTYSITKITKH